MKSKEDEKENVASDLSTLTVALDAEPEGVTEELKKIKYQRSKIKDQT